MAGNKPKIFIGSSVKGLDLARAVKANLEYDTHSSVWEHVFGLSKTTIETLTSKLHEFDYGVFIFSPDDEIDMSEKHFTVSRDNVIFEAGLFMGMHGRDKCFIITPRGVPDYHNLTDLDGFTTGTYDVDFADTDPINALGTASDKIRKGIKGPSGLTRTKGNKIPFEFESRVTFFVKEGITYPLKLHITFTNVSPESLTIKDLEFYSESNLTLAKGFDENINPTTARPRISLYPEKEVRKSEVTIEPSKQAMLWIAFENASKSKLEQLVEKKKAGILKFTLVNGRSGKAEKQALDI
jgi:hypothetical protein